MKQILAITSLFLTLLFTSCSSKDEPEPVYNGPWVIEYYESFYMMHTDNPDFQTWFNNHTKDFSAGRIIWFNGTEHRFDALAPDETYETFKECYEKKSGELVWYEIIEKASEEDMQAKKTEFEKFTVKDDVNRHYDIFQANYQKLDSDKYKAK